MVRTRMTPGQQATFFLQSVVDGYESDTFDYDEARKMLAFMKHMAPNSLLKARISAQEARLDDLRTFRNRAAQGLPAPQSRLYKRVTAHC